MFELDAYLERIGLRGRPGIAEIHRAHVSSIPFENLDPFRGLAVSLDLGDLERKLIAERRGGYCFEHNLLFKAALEALGAEVEPILARVGDRGTERSRTHLLLRVDLDGEVWHADVGFGRGTLLEPIPFGPGEEHVQEGWRLSRHRRRPGAGAADLDRWRMGRRILVRARARAADRHRDEQLVHGDPPPFAVRLAGISAAMYDQQAVAVSLSDWSGR